MSVSSSYGGETIRATPKRKLVHGLQSKTVGKNTGCRWDEHWKLGFRHSHGGLGQAGSEIRFDRRTNVSHGPGLRQDRLLCKPRTDGQRAANGSDWTGMTCLFRIVEDRVMHRISSSEERLIARLGQSQKNKKGEPLFDRFSSMLEMGVVALAAGQGRQ